MDFLDEEDIQGLLYLKPLNLLHIYGNRREVVPILIPQNKVLPGGNKPNLVLGVREDQISNRPIVPDHYSPLFTSNTINVLSELPRTDNCVLNQSTAFLALQGFNPFENEERLEYTEYLRDCIQLKTLKHSDKLVRYKEAAVFHISTINGFESKANPKDSDTPKQNEFTKLYSNQRANLYFQPNKELCKLFKIKFKAPAASESVAQTPEPQTYIEELNIAYDYSSMRPNQNVFDALFGEEEPEESEPMLPDFSFSVPSMHVMTHSSKREYSSGTIEFKKRRIRK